MIAPMVKHGGERDAPRVAARSRFATVEEVGKKGHAAWQGWARVILPKGGAIS